MGTFTIGRLSIGDPDKLVHAGDDGLQVSGWIFGASMAAAKVLRQQALGLGDTVRGEPVVPVTWSTDSTIDGFYRLTRPPRVSAIEATYQTVYGFRVDFDLERVAGGYQLPSAESYTVGTSRTGIPGGVTPAYLVGYPSTATAFDYGGTLRTTYDRVGPGGTARVVTDSGLAAAYSRQRIAPASWYDMGCYIKVGGDYVVGAEIPAAGNDENWEIGNGYVKVVSAPAATDRTFNVVGPGATPSSWGTNTGYTIVWANGVYTQPNNTWPIKATAISHVEVIRCQPHCATLRLWGQIAYITSPSQWTDVAIDLRIRRGSAIIEGAISVSATPAWYWGIIRSGAAAASHQLITGGGGIYPTSNDADGNRWCMFTGTSTTTGAANAYWYQGELVASSFVSTFDFGLGCSYATNAGTGVASAPGNSTDLRDQYFAAMDEVVHLGVQR